MRQSKVKQKKPNLTKILLYVWSHCKQGATKCSSKQPKIATDFAWFIRVTGILSGYVRLHAQSHCKLPIQMVRANVTLNQIKLCSGLLVKLQQYFALCPNFLQIFCSFLQSIKRSKKTTKSSVKQPKLITSFADFKESSEYFLKNTTVKSCCKLSIYIVCTNVTLNQLKYVARDRRPPNVLQRNSIFCKILKGLLNTDSNDCMFEAAVNCQLTPCIGS